MGEKNPVSEEYTDVAGQLSDKLECLLPKSSYEQQEHSLRDEQKYLRGNLLSFLDNHL